MARQSKRATSIISAFLVSVAAGGLALAADAIIRNSPSIKFLGLRDAPIATPSSGTTDRANNASTALLDLGHGSLVAVFSATSVGHGTGYAYSSNYGLSWIDGVVGEATGTDSSPPTLAHDHALSTVYLATQSRTGRSIEIFRSTDKGRSWSQSAEGTARFGGIARRPSLAVDNPAGAPQGDLYLCWTRFGEESTGSAIMLTRFDDPGATLRSTDPAIVLSRGDGCSVVVAPNHQVNVFYYRGAAAGDQNGRAALYLRRSSDRGKTFAPEIVVAHLNGTDANGDLRLHGGLASDSFPHAAVNQTSGRAYLYVAFNDDPDPSDPLDNGDIYLTYSLDSGRSWTKAVRVNDDLEGDQYSPAIAFAGDDRLMVSYHSRSQDPANRMFHRRARLASLVSNGAPTFNPSFQLGPNTPPTSGPVPRADTVAGGAPGQTANDTAFALAWSDNRRRNESGQIRPDVQFARIFGKPPKTDLRVTAIPGPPTVKQGQRVAMAVNVSAAGGVARDVFLNVTLGTGLELESIDGDGHCDAIEGFVGCSLGSMAPGQTKTIQIVANATDARSKEAVLIGATTSSQDSNSKNNIAFRFLEILGGPSPDETLPGGPIASRALGSFKAAEVTADPTSEISGVLPSYFRPATIWSGLNSPTAVRFAPDGQVFVAEKAGIIKVFSSISDPTPYIFADLRPQVHDYSDRGLNGLAIDPQFPTRPYLYVLYALDAPPGQEPPVYNDACPEGSRCPAFTRLERIAVNGGIIGDRATLFEGWCQDSHNHSAGDLAFGSDGYLYASHGDGGSAGSVDFGKGFYVCPDPPDEGGALHAQDMETPADSLTYAGSIIRIDPDTGAAAPGNPLIGTGSSDDDPVVAYGLRNPFRFTIDHLGGERIWIADVGWNAWEEIDSLVTPTQGPVKNFGWPCYEGADPQSGYQAANLSICNALYAAGTSEGPYYSYAHASGSNAITAINLYRGDTYTAALNGALFFADYAQGWIKVMPAGADGLPDPASVSDVIASGVSPVDLQRGPDGGLYFADISRGSIRRIVFQDTPPTANIQADRTSGALPLTVSFNGAASSDPDSGDTLSFAWDLDGDREFDDSATSATSYTYTQQAAVVVSLRVTDHGGLTNTASITVYAGSTDFTLPPAADTFVDQTAPSTSRGGATTLIAKTASATTRHAYLKFDTSAVTTQIVSAKLRLSLQANGTSFPLAGSFAVREFTSNAWTEATTWNTRPTDSGNLGSQLGSSGTLPITTPQVMEVDVTDYINAQRASGSSVVSFTVRSLATNNSAVLIDSRESQNPPQLLLVGEPPPRCTLVASPSSIDEGDSAVLSWNTAEAASGTIDNGVGQMLPVAAGSAAMTPSQTTTYTATVVSPEGQQGFCTATVEVRYRNTSDDPVLIGQTPPNPVPQSPPPISGLDGPYEMVVSGNYAYVTNERLGSFAVFDVADPARPTFVAESPRPGINARGLSISEGYAYLADPVDDSISIFDIANPKVPRFAGKLKNSILLNGARSIATDGDVAYVGNTDADSLAIVDISNRRQPAILATNRGPAPGSSLNAVTDIAVAGGHAYVASSGGGGLNIFDVSNPANPIWLSMVPCPGGANASVHGVKVVGRYAYLACAANRSFGVVDVSDPANPVVVGFTNGPEPGTTFAAAFHLAVYGHYAYVTLSDFSGPQGKIVVVDIADPANPTVVGQTAQIREARAVFAHGRYLYAGSDAWDNVMVFDIGAPAAVAAPTCELQAPMSISQGQTASLAWTSERAVFGTFDQGLGVLDPVAGGTRDISPVLTSEHRASVIDDLGQRGACYSTVEVVPALGNSVTLAPTADTFVSQASPNTSYGDVTPLLTKTASSTTRHAYLKFNTSSFGGQVILAKLRLSLQANGANLSDPGQFSVFEFLGNAWTESATWNTRPADTSLGRYLASKTLPLIDAETMEIDVTDYVQAQRMAGASAISFSIRSYGVGGALVNSRESISPPELVLIRSN